jgi:hypothetical protein
MDADICIAAGLLYSNLHWWFPVTLYTYGVKFKTRELDKMCYVVDNSDIP